MQNNYLSNYSLTHTNPYSLFIQPYAEGIENFRRGEPLAGLGLMIPIVNTIVLLALRYFCTRPDAPIKYHAPRMQPNYHFSIQKIKEQKIEGISVAAKGLKTDQNLYPDLYAAFCRLQKPKKNALPENPETIAKKKRQIVNLALRLQNQPLYHSYLNGLIAYADNKHSEGSPDYFYKETHPEGICLTDAAEDLELLVPNLNATADSTRELRVFDTAYAPVEGQVEGA